MPKNFLVGIGGSGARVTEAAIFLGAAGIGPDKLFLFLIDPDKGNGNLGRTSRLMSAYLDCRKKFVPHESGIGLFHTDLVVPEEEKDRIWSIFEKPKMTLGEWIGFDGLNEESQRDEKDFMSILFSKQELTTELDMGFRGHPSIGSVVMTELPENNYPFKLLWDEIPESKAFDIRLFLVGSVFGGTGAAGFPTLGHRNTLKFNAAKGATINEKDSISRILLGGSLILPYFKVVKNDQQQDMHVTSGDFPIATKAALEFYDTKDNLGFDQLYFIGDSLSQSVGDFSVGSTSQENKPHYIEIVSSLAAFDFFRQPASEKKAEDPQYFIAKRENEKITWSSFPFSRNEENISQVQDQFKTRLTAMTVFSYALVTYGRSMLNPEEDARNKMEFKHPWYEHFNHTKGNNEFLNPRTPDNADFLKKMVEFCEQFLDWIIALSDYDNVALIDKTKLTDGKRNWKSPVNLTLIGELLKENSHKRGWADKDGFLQALNAEDLNKRISKNTKSMSAANRFLNLFYEASESFAKTNYTIN